MKEIPIWQQYTLSIEEAAAYFRIGEKKLRQLVSENENAPFVLMNGNRRIDKAKLSDAKGWLIKLQKDGRGYSSIKTVRGVVRPAFQMATDDDLIRKNPFDFQLATVVVNDSVTREAITRKQQ